ncbi:hypothetical protein QA089_004821 [Meyerozyma guilliermondii]
MTSRKTKISRVSNTVQTTDENTVVSWVRRGFRLWRGSKYNKSVSIHSETQTPDSVKRSATNASPLSLWLKGGLKPFVHCSHDSWLLKYSSRTADNLSTEQLVV